jgi:RimJ/RimL family protein N-acetyltransferase
VTTDRAGLAHLVVARGSRVAIRRKVREDAAEDYRWRTDADNARFDGAFALRQSFDEFLRQMESDLAFGPPEKEQFAIIDSGGEHIGNVMYYNADSYQGTAEFGISLGLESSRGQGLGTEAAVLFLRYIWANYPFRRVYLHTLAWNKRAIASFRKAGFDSAVTLERDGQEFVRMEARREWWLLWDDEGRFSAPAPGKRPGKSAAGEAP